MSKPNRQPTPRQLQGMRALSIRQPFASLIVAGRKVVEYRSWRTHVLHERILIYSSKSRGDSLDEHITAIEHGLTDDELAAMPRGVLVGSVEILDCEKLSADEFRWRLSSPIRFKRPIAVPPGRQPTPGFWFPFGPPRSRSSRK